MAADHSTLSVECGRNTMRHDIFHFCVFFLVIEVPLCRTLYNGAGHAVRKMLLDAGSNLQDLVLRIMAERDHTLQHRFCIGERTGLVKDNAVCLSKSLQIFSAFNGDIMVCRLTDRRNHGNRRRQLDGTGIIHHQNGDSLCDVAGQQQCQTKAQETKRHNTICQVFCTALDTCLEVFRIVDQLDDLLNLGVAAECIDLHCNHTLIHNRTGENSRTLCLTNTERFACHRRLVDIRLAGDNSTIHRNYAAGTDTNHIADLEIRHRNQHIGVVLYQPYLIGLDRQAIR